MIDAKYNHIVNDGVDVSIDRDIPYSGKATISRFKGSYSDYNMANRRQINLLLESNVTTGEIVTNENDHYLVVVVKKEIVQGQDVSLIAHGMLCNVTLTVTRDTPIYDEYGNQIDSTTEIVLDAIPCHAAQVTDRMRQEDPGLLPTTVLKVKAQHHPELLLLDKAAIASNYYRVDDINLLEFPGCMSLQLSIWNG